MIISQVKLTDKEYKEALEIINGLNDDGFTDEEQQKRDEQQKRFEEARQESLIGPKF